MPVPDDRYDDGDDHRRFWSGWRLKAAAIAGGVAVFVGGIGVGEAIPSLGPHHRGPSAGLVADKGVDPAKLRGPVAGHPSSGSLFLDNADGNLYQCELAPAKPHGSKTVRVVIYHARPYQCDELAHAEDQPHTETKYVFTIKTPPPRASATIAP